jgi:hypothetical protein
MFMTRYKYSIDSLLEVITTDAMQAVTSWLFNRQGFAQLFKKNVILEDPNVLQRLLVILLQLIRIFRYQKAVSGAEKLRIANR